MATGRADLGPEFRIYISSTIDDLVAERASAADIAGKHGRLIDSYRVTEEAHVVKCVQDVRQAHLYIGIIGRRLGWIAQQRGDGQPVSITELEYEACEAPGQPKIPRLMFLRGVTADADDDGRDAKYDAAQQTLRRQAVDRLRARAGSTGFVFRDLREFELRLQEAVITKRQEHFRAAVPGRPLLEQEKHWPSRLKPLALLSVAGADEAWRDRLLAGQRDQIVDATLRITDADLAVQADQGLREAQVAALLVSPASLALLDTPQRRGAMARLLAMLRRRVNVAPLVCLDGSQHMLPATWPAGETLPLDGAALQADPAGTTDQLLRALRQHATLSSQTRLALPALVLAPTEREVQALLADPDAEFAHIADKDVRGKRRRQLADLIKALRLANRDWPAGVYGLRRDDWRCFGAGTGSARSLLDVALHTLNTALPGSRERETLGQATLLLRPYGLDEYLTDEDGSRRVVEATCERGALVLVDELVLLMPRLRQAAQELLKRERCAVVTLCASDPTRLGTPQLVGEFSFLRVGAVVERFDQRHDPQCELHLNSATRLERWLRTAIPRLAVDLAGLKGQPALVSRADEILP